jgi:hypothetical protein
MPENADNTAVVPTASPEEANQTGDRERRVQQRFAFTADAEVVEVRSEARVTGRCSDLGPGGCYVDTLTPFAVGSGVRVRLSRENREFEAGAVITYARVPLGMGMRFTEASRKHKAVLNAWIAELSGGRTPVTADSAAENESAVCEDNANMLIVLNQLIALLVRKKVLTENESVGLLRKMFG